MLIVSGFSSTVALAIPFLVAGSAAFADCTPFAAFSDGSERQVNYVDQGPDGLSVGDRRIGYRAVKSSDGAQIGHHSWINTVVFANPDTGIIRSFEDHVIRFDDGQVFFSVSNELIRLPSDTAKPSVPDHSGAVTGGTGSYARAQGVVDVSFEGTAIEYGFDINCD